MPRKPLLILACAALLLTATALGTVAFFTDNDQVVNTFTIGHVELTLDESAVTPDGTVIPDAPRVQGNEYHLLPGKSYIKDPTVTVKAGSDESYVRMLVTVNKAAELQAIFGADFLPETYVSGWNAAIWPCHGFAADTAANTLTYEFRYHQPVTAAADMALEPLFTSLNVPGELTAEQLQTLSGLNITVVAHAIQTATFADADAAWAAFDAQTAASATIPQIQPEPAPGA